MHPLTTGFSTWSNTVPEVYFDLLLCHPSVFILLIILLTEIFLANQLLFVITSHQKRICSRPTIIDRLLRPNLKEQNMQCCVIDLRPREALLHLD